MIPASPDPGAILLSIAEVPFEWAIDTDEIAWGTNVRAVLQVADEVDLGSALAFGARIDASGRQARLDAVFRSASRDLGAGVPYRVEYAFTPMAGAQPMWLEETGRWFAGVDGRPRRAHGVLRVVTERHAEQERLDRLAHFDPQTGEMNRTRLNALIEATVEEAVRLRTPSGFLLVAVDNLGSVNAAYGYDVADEVIAAIAKCLRGRLRAQDRLGRFSGNKFGVVLNNCTADDLVIAADRLLGGVREEPMPTSAGPIAATVTIGGVSMPQHARTLREVLSRAQDALDSAKVRRRGSFQAYRPNLERETLRQASARSTDEILSALNERRVFLAFEPVVATATREPAFYECLMRARRPDGSMMPAHDLVPAAERVGLVRLLDHRVLSLVVEELVAAPALRASLNVSAPSTVDPNWWSGLAAMLHARTEIAERLTIEITETAAIHDIDEMRSFVARVKDLGCRIAIDDFGAGYTSFRNLRKLGVDMVKIDGAFVQNIVGSEDDRVFVRAMLDLARRMRLSSVAEWVQDEETAALLAEWGCDYLQGKLTGLASPRRPWRPDDAAPSAASA